MKEYYYPAKVTSIQEKQSYGEKSNEFRVTFEGGHWRDVTAKEIVKDTEENRALLAIINSHREAIKKAEDEIKTVEAKLVRFTEQELTGEE